MIPLYMRNQWNFKNRSIINGPKGLFLIIFKGNYLSLPLQNNI